MLDHVVFSPLTGTLFTVRRTQSRWTDMSISVSGDAKIISVSVKDWATSNSAAFVLATYACYDEGIISPSDITVYPAGSVVTVTATPNSSLRFSNWVIDGSIVATANPLTITMDSNHTLVAVFTGVPLY